MESPGATSSASVEPALRRSSTIGESAPLHGGLLKFKSMQGMAPRRPWNRVVTDRKWMSVRGTVDDDAWSSKPEGSSSRDRRRRPSPPGPTGSRARRSAVVSAAPSRRAARRRKCKFFEEQNGAIGLRPNGAGDTNHAMFAIVERASIRCAAVALAVVGGDEDGDSRGSSEHRARAVRRRSEGESLKDEGANSRRKSDSPRQPPLFPRKIHHRSRLACR